MATTITMPQLGETVTEGTVERWLKAPGDAVEKYEAFVEVSTDKVNSEVPAPVSGTIRELLVQEGATVATGTPIAIIDEVGAAAPPPRPAEPEAPAAKAAAAPSAPRHLGNGHVKTQTAEQPVEAALRGASPAVRRLAREHRVDISTLQGSGANGRVTAEDVLAAAGTAPAARPVAAAAKPQAGKSTYDDPIPGTIIPLTSARRIIAQRMVESKHTAPHAWSMVEVDVTNVWKWRGREKETFERDTGYKLTLLPFFVRAVVESLAAFPLMNARFTPDGIVVEKAINVGVAVGLATSLVVPVVRNADTLGIKGLAFAMGDLIDQARRNKLSPDALQGGTFTVNNTGANGSYASAPIINGGQAGIITMETIVKRPVVTRDDAIAIRQMMNVCLSLDHRVVDGMIASGFLNDVKKRLEAMGPTGIL